MKRKTPAKPKGPSLAFYNEEHFEELRKMLKSSLEQDKTDVTLSFDNGTLDAHSFILGLKSSVFRVAMESFPPGFQFYISCPGVRLEIFRHMLELIYEGETVVEVSDLDEFKSVAKAYLISLADTNMAKDDISEDVGLREAQAFSSEQFLDLNEEEPTPKRKRGRPRKSEVVVLNPPEDVEKLPDSPVVKEELSGIARPNTRKKVIDFKALYEDDIEPQIDSDSSPEDGSPVFVLGQQLELENDMQLDAESDSDYEPFCSPVPPEEEQEDTNDASFEASIEDDDMGEDPEYAESEPEKKPTVKKKRSERYEGEHSCAVCKIEFENVTVLRDHYNMEHKRDGRFFCKDCEYSSNNMSALVVHRRKHTGERPFVCSFCGRCFGHSGTLSEHVNLHTGNKPYKCDECGSSFAQRKKLHIHRCSSPSPREDGKLADPTDLRFPCQDCGRKFMNRKALAHHRIYHTDREPKPKIILCDICGRGFSNKYLLKSHSATHAERKTFMCDICGRGYFSKKALENHLVNHTGDYLYACSMCDRKFKDQVKLTYHEQTHSGVKDLQCQYCPENFRLKSLLENHMLLHTNDGTKYVCDCGKVFLNYKYLQKHRLVHARRQRCRFCRKAFETDEQLRNHEELHENGALAVTKNNPLAKEMRNMLRIGCSHCDAKFRNEEEFAEHAIEHEEEAYRNQPREEGEIGYTSTGGVGEIVYYTEEGEVKTSQEEWSYEVVMQHSSDHEGASVAHYSAMI